MRKKEEKFSLKELSPISTSLSISLLMMFLEFLNGIFYTLSKGSTLPFLGNGLGISIMKTFHDAKIIPFYSSIILAPIVSFIFYFVLVLIFVTIYNTIASFAPIKAKLQK